MTTSHVGRDFAHRGFDFVGNVGDDLDGFAQVVAPPFAGNHRSYIRPEVTLLAWDSGAWVNRS